jgi:hypothetical protein
MCHRIIQPLCITLTPFFNSCFHFILLSLEHELLPDYHFWRYYQLLALYFCFWLQSTGVNNTVSCLYEQQKRPTLPEDTPQELVFIVQSCWVEDPCMRPSFSQIIRMLESFLMTIPPPPPAEPNEDEESEETRSSLSSRSSSGSSLVSRATSKLSVVRHLFASKKAGNGKAWCVAPRCFPLVL